MYVVALVSLSLYVLLWLCWLVLLWMCFGLIRLTVGVYSAVLETEKENWGRDVDQMETWFFLK